MITDDMLYKSAAVANEALLSTLPADKDLEHEFSRRFERKMNKLIRHTKYHIVYSILKTAACFVLISILAAAMFLTSNVKAREAFFEWVKEKYEDFIEYYFDGMVGNEVIEDNAMAEYRLGWVPEGYVESEVRINSINTIVIYTDSLNNFITFNYHKTPTQTNLVFLEQHLYTYSSAKINDITADIYISLTPHEANTIIWSAPSENILFTISGFHDKSILIEMAENIIKIEK